MNITSSTKNYERGQIAQAAHNYLNTVRDWGSRNGKQSSINTARYEFAQLIGNELQYRPDWTSEESDEEAINIAKLVILMSEGFIPELWKC